MTPDNLYGLIAVTAQRLGLLYINADLKQDCALACVRAMQRYQPGRAALSTYLVPRIRGTILDSIRPGRSPAAIAKQNAVHVPYVEYYL